MEVRGGVYHSSVAIVVCFMVGQQSDFTGAMIQTVYVVNCKLMECKTGQL